MDAIQTVVILIRHIQHRTEALSIGRALLRAGISVTLFWLCDVSLAMPRSADKVILNLKERDVPCYTYDPFAACCLGLDCLSINEMARQIKQADMVMPF